MDNGEVIPGLNEPWTLAGAKLSEWSAGFVMFMIFGSTIFVPVSRYMPHLLLVLGGTTIGMAAMRRAFPDEERGIMNYVMTSCGVAPPGIPAPATVQPYWSAAPLRKLREDCNFVRFGLDEVLTAKDAENEEEKTGGR